MEIFGRMSKDLDTTSLDWCLDINSNALATKLAVEGAQRVEMFKKPGGDMRFFEDAEMGIILSACWSTAAA
ncbi:hypothetical protein V6N13_087839 [Hibiscus sabdariffa]|uniref:Uncharacterized protein n=1 Tax=Hibiscus sabdariffa TaxID=183260 RepID=A0ABR2FXH3_9ROSI